MKPISKYAQETQQVDFGGRNITLTNWTPIFTSTSEREKRKKEIEAQLYNLCMRIKSRAN